MSSPSNRNTWQNCALHSRAALCAIMSNTGWTSVGELEITLRISLVAVSRSRASLSSLVRMSSCCFESAYESSSRPAMSARSRAICPRNRFPRTFGAVSAVGPWRPESLIRLPRRRFRNARTTIPTMLRILAACTRRSASAYHTWVFRCPGVRHPRMSMPGSSGGPLRTRPCREQLDERSGFGVRRC